MLYFILYYSIYNCLPCFICLFYVHCMIELQIRKYLLPNNYRSYRYASLIKDDFCGIGNPGLNYSKNAISVLLGLSFDLSASKNVKLINTRVNSNIFPLGHVYG